MADTRHVTIREDETGRYFIYVGENRSPVAVAYTKLGAWWKGRRIRHRLRRNLYIAVLH